MAGQYGSTSKKASPLIPLYMLKPVDVLARPLPCPRKMCSNSIPPTQKWMPGLVMAPLALPLDVNQNARAGRMFNNDSTSVRKRCKSMYSIANKKN